MERDEHDLVMSAPREVAIRDTAPPQSSRNFEGSHAHSAKPLESSHAQSSRTLESSHAQSWASSIPDVSRHSPSDVWAGAISRLQTQVSLNTSMLESHRRQLQDVDLAVRALGQDFNKLYAGFHDIRAELQSRPSVPPHARNDPGDLEVLSEQVGLIGSKANEVDGIKMQLDLLKNRMKRWEEQGNSTLLPHRPRMESEQHEIPPLTHLDRQSQQNALPPMRTSSIASPIDSHPPMQPLTHVHPPVPIMDSHARAGHHPSAEHPRFSIESSRTMQGASNSSYRPSESLPPPSTLPGWRSSESLPGPHGPPFNPVMESQAPPQTSANDAHTSGWASVNANHASKRPFEDPPRPSPYESPRSGSPKRPRLAPMIPRSSYGDDSYAPSSIGPSHTADSSLRPESRATSDASHPHSRLIPTPDSASGSNYRFITSTAQGDSQDSWRPERERRMHMHHHGPHERGGRGRGRRGGRGGGGGGGGRRGARGGGVQLPDSQQFGTPEWEKPEWTGSQVSPNGYYHALHPYSPRGGGRGGLVRRGGGIPGTSGPPPEREEYLDLPTYASYDPSVAESGDGDADNGSGNKKTRTKPIRNADGVLIRKDGRPDMRSVSSAANLRRVHAKKEADRAGDFEDRTPTSRRSLAPADAYSDDEEEEQLGGSQDTPGPEELDVEVTSPPGRANVNLIRRIFPEPGENAKAAAERYFPRSRSGEHEAADVRMKTEEAEEATGDRAAEQASAGSQMTDVVMREMSEAQAEDHRLRRESTRMDTVDESREQRVGGDERSNVTAADGSAEQAVT